MEPNVGVRIFRLDQNLMMEVLVFSRNFDAGGRRRVEPESELPVNPRFVFARPVCRQSAEDRDLKVPDEIVEGHPEAAIPRRRALVFSFAMF